jgi:hypothetical protein
MIAVVTWGLAEMAIDDGGALWRGFGSVGSPRPKVWRLFFLFPAQTKSYENSSDQRIQSSKNMLRLAVI